MNDHVDSKPADEAGAPTPAEGTASQPENLGEGGGNVHQEGTSTVPSDSEPPEGEGVSTKVVLTPLNKEGFLPDNPLGRAVSDLLDKHFGSSSRKKGPKRGSKVSHPTKMTTDVYTLRSKSVITLIDVSPLEKDVTSTTPATLELIGKSIFIDIDDKRKEAWQGITKFVDENWVPIKTGISAVAVVYMYMLLMFLTGYSVQSGINTANKEPK